MLPGEPRAARQLARRRFGPYLNGREYLNFTEYSTDPARFYTAGGRTGGSAR